MVDALQQTFQLIFLCRGKRQQRTYTLRLLAQAVLYCIDMRRHIFIPKPLDNAYHIVLDGGWVQ